jgi:hypothetical protein
MIGVDVPISVRPIVREFFQLFKTPWEFVSPGRHYRVQISTASRPDFARADLTIVYLETPPSQSPENSTADAGKELEFQSRILPIYCGLKTFPAAPANILHERRSAVSALDAERTPQGTLVFVGYALFAEVEHLLTVGQPLRFAGVPTLEHHISLLRELILRAGFAVVEIPPKAAGHPLIVCLTHDVDHPLQRRHIFDHTMGGFLYRATIGSVFNTLRGRITLRQLGRNFAAVLQAPFMAAGIAPDNWSRFDDYLGIEEGLGATYFVIPKAKYAGRMLAGSAPANRASGYGAADIRDQLQRIRAAGCEIGTHGLDAWIDADAGRLEREAIASTTGTNASGVRMHWLYFDAKSARTLESAGFDYDSTVGYNQTVGFRAGTVQAFAPIGTSTLMELPLHVMDTALFYPSYLNLTDAKAFALVQDLIRFAVKNSGVLTFNWHDRSLFPERLWGDVYQEIIAELKRYGAWFPNAGDAVRWFRMRRDASLEVETSDRGVAFIGHGSGGRDLPSLVVHVTGPCVRRTGEALAQAEPNHSQEFPFAGHHQVCFKP